MKRKPSIHIMAAAVIMATAAILARDAAAGEYHTAGKGLVCSDCHSMHASSKGQLSIPSRYLLKRSDEVALCLSCHDGADVNAPDIISTGTLSNPDSIVVTAYQSKYGSSAGVFQGDSLSAGSEVGHDMFTAGQAPLSSTYNKPTGLVCSDCHDPHGSANYRNLVSDPNPAHPGSYEIIVGAHVKEAVAVNALTPNPAEAYDTGNVTFFTNNNIKGWCSDCHDGLSQNSQGVSPAHFTMHPSDADIGENSSHTSLSNWLNGTDGFGIDVGDSTAGIPRLRFGSATGSSIPAQGDTVTCLSCHKAHGSSNHAGLVWPYKTDSADSLSGCQQCHSK